MRYRKTKLSHQLISLIVLAFVILFISLGVILPKMLIPVAEKNIYTYLSEPLKFVSNSPIDKSLLNTEIAYIYIVDNDVATSENIRQVISIKDIKKLLSYMNDDYGKFSYDHHTYYYYTISRDGIKKIAKERGQEVADKIADNIIKNTYRTLMTRGMKGCYVYCTNKELAEYLKNNI